VVGSLADVVGSLADVVGIHRDVVGSHRDVVGSLADLVGSLADLVGNPADTAQRATCEPRNFKKIPLRFPDHLAYYTKYDVFFRLTLPDVGLGSFT
jgi:hypothetical protein